jgi:hypothetical protein
MIRAGLISTSGARVIVKALAIGLKVILSSSVVAAVRETAVLFEMSNVAVSNGPLGTTAGVQLAGLIHCILAGLRFQVALPA